MTVLLAAVLCQTDPAEFERLLAEFQLAMEAEYSASAMEPTARSKEAVSRLDTPSSRDALWRTLTDPSLPPETRFAVVEALSRMGDLRNFEQLLTSLAQIKASGNPVATRVEAVEKRIRSRHAPAPATVAPPRKPTPPSPARSDRWNVTNVILGGAALGLAVLLWLIRRGRP